MRLVVALLALCGCAGGPVAVQGPPSPETATIQGLRVRTEPGERAPGDSLAFVLDFRSVRGPDGKYSPSPWFTNCPLRLDRWDGAAWEPVPNELWRPGALFRQAHRPDVAGIICADAPSSWITRRRASRRFSYQLSSEAEPGWYRWCLTVTPNGERGERWLCSNAIIVGHAARPAG